MGLPERHNDSYFRTTRWTLISQMRNLTDDSSRKIQNELYQDYWKPICRYIMSKGNSMERSYDLTQEFFYKQVIMNGLFEKAYASRGKFRSLLLSSLNNFLISQNRHASADKRSPEIGMISLESLDDSLGELPDFCVDEEDQFNYAWIQSVLENTAARLKEHYTTKYPNYWEAFYMRVLEPILTQSEAPSLEQVCQRTGVADVSVVSNIILTVKRRFQSELRSHIREYVNSEDEVGDEISVFLRFLKKFLQDS